MIEKVSKVQNERVIAFYPKFADLTGSLHAGVLLSQVFYWFSNNRLRVRRKGRLWLAKTREELAGECGLSLDQYKRAIRKLKDAGLVVVEGHRFNGLRVSYLWIDRDRLSELLHSVGECRSNRSVEMAPPGGSKTTLPITENTNRDYDREQHERAAHAREHGRITRLELVPREEQVHESQNAVEQRATAPQKYKEMTEPETYFEKGDGLRYIPDWVAERPGYGEKRLGITFTAEEWGAKAVELMARDGTD